MKKSTRFLLSLLSAAAFLSSCDTGDTLSAGDQDLEDLSGARVLTVEDSHGYEYIIIGTNDWDTIEAEGSALILGYGGGDDIYGSSGNDVIYGGNGIEGHDSGDEIEAGPGNDIIYGDRGGDYLEGESGDDRIYPGFDDKLIRPGLGRDLIALTPNSNRYTIDLVDNIDTICFMINKKNLNQPAEVRIGNGKPPIVHTSFSFKTLIVCDNPTEPITITVVKDHYTTLHNQHYVEKEIRYGKKLIYTVIIEDSYMQANNDIPIISNAAFYNIWKNHAYPNYRFNPYGDDLF